MTDSIGNSKEGGKSAGYDEFGLLQLVDVFDRRLSEIESNDMLTLIDRVKLCEVTEAIAEQFNAIQVQIIVDIKYLESLCGDAFLSALPIPDMNALTELYHQAGESWSIGDTKNSSRVSLELCVTSVLKVLLAASRDLPKRNSDGSFDRTHLKTALDPLREHPYVLRNYRGIWNRLKRGLVDYLNARQAWLRASGHIVNPRPIVIRADDSELFLAHRRAFYCDYLLTSPGLISSLRIVIIMKLNLGNKIEIKKLIKISTHELVSGLMQVGFEPFKKTSAFCRLIQAIETNLSLGIIPESVDEQSFYTLCDQYYMHLKTTNFTPDLVGAYTTLLETYSESE